MARHSKNRDIPKAKLTKENLKEALMIFRYVKPYRGTFIAGLLFISLSSATTMAFPYLLKELINSTHAISQGQAALGTGAIAWIMMGVLAVQMIFSYLRVYLFTYVGEHALADMRRDMYKKMIVMPMDFFAHRRVGELSSRISADLSQIQDAVTVMLAEILRGVLTLLIGMGLILYLSKELTLVMLSVVPLVVIVAVIFGKRIRKLSRTAQDQLADSNTVVQETLQGIANVKAFTNEWFEIGRYTRNLQQVVKLAVKNGQLRGLFVSFLLFSVFGTIVLVVWYGTKLLAFGDLTAFVVYTAFVGGTMAGFADLYGQLQKTLGATQRVRELLRETTEPINPEGEAAEAIKPENTLHGRVSLQHIAFNYPSRKEVQVLSDVCIDAAPGEQVAIVGPSGAGKSTIAALLLRFYEPDAGSLLFDGRPVTGIPLTQLRKQIALVPQDVLLFGGSIRENIAYGKPAATDAEIEAAARKANAHAFITSFPEGYETVVGERGIKLSGGQRQRIAIARAILKDPVILVLDEATSSLDAASESLVQEALDNLMRNRTSFIIAHRLSTIRHADKIVVLDKGKVVESGTHEELINLPEGLYRNLNLIAENTEFRSQNSEAI
jgi:ABC-type multidrug transport system fused ATPase/permease subunit